MKLKKPLLFDKLKFTVCIVIIYLLGRFVPLYGVDTSTISSTEVDMQVLLTQTITGDINQISLFSLGIFPYMISNILVQMGSRCLQTDHRTKNSAMTINKYTLVIMIVVAGIQAYLRLDELSFIYEDEFAFLAKTVAVIEMIVGSIVILWISERNKSHGIGGQTLLIYINILDNFRGNLINQVLKDLYLPILIALFGVIIMLLMENTEKRIPMQRISIFSIYGDQNYLAIKLNPIGVMPIMFATTFYILPQFLGKLLQDFFPYNYRISWFVENNTVSKPLGIAIYILVLYFLTIVFSLIMINPRDMMEQQQKSGDSIIGIRAGKETLKYLRKNVILISCFSATVMSLCMGVPMIMQLYCEVSNSLISIPPSVMMMTGLWCNLSREVKAINSLDSYMPFI